MTFRGNDTVEFPQMRNEIVSNILEGRGSAATIDHLASRGFIGAWLGAETLAAHDIEFDDLSRSTADVLRYDAGRITGSKDASRAPKLPMRGSVFIRAAGRLSPKKHGSRAWPRVAK